MDFDRLVEAVFVLNPAVRASERKRYCASSPWFLPHLFAQLTIRKECSYSVVLPDQGLALTVLGRAERTPIAYSERPERLEFILGDPCVRVIPLGVSSDGKTELHFVLEARHPLTVRLEHAGDSVSRVMGSDMLSFPDYLDLFASDAPAQGVELSVGTIAVLFTDLTGSTALYSRMGDARAFALVQRHFRMLEHCAREQNGAIVKTMGDAVMATFPSLQAALRAALAMIRAADAELGYEQVALKIGINAGPCLAVRANDRLDFFGTTVNVAARLQAQAGPREIVVQEEALDHPEVRAILDGFAQSPFEAILKGVQERKRLISIAPM